MSKKGQLVVPITLRKKLGLVPEDNFIAYGTEDYIIFKKVALPQLKKEFEDLVKTTSEIAGKRNITIETVEAEITEYKREKRKTT